MVRSSGALVSNRNRATVLLMESMPDPGAPHHLEPCIRRARLRVASGMTPCARFLGALQPAMARRFLCDYPSMANWQQTARRFRRAGDSPRTITRLPMKSRSGKTPGRTQSGRPASLRPRMPSTTIHSIDGVTERPRAVPVVRHDSPWSLSLDTVIDQPRMSRLPGFARQRSAVIQAVSRVAVPLPFASGRSRVPRQLLQAGFGTSDHRQVFVVDEDADTQAIGQRHKASRHVVSRRRRPEFAAFNSPF